MREVGIRAQFATMGMWAISEVLEDFEDFLTRTALEGRREARLAAGAARVGLSSTALVSRVSGAHLFSGSP
jgi:hypothetical protein